MRQSSSPALTYIRSLFALESAATRAAREALEQHAPEIAGISIGAEEGKLLQLLIRMNDIKRVVEIGSLTGYSGLWMAEALPADGEIHLIEYNPEHAALIRARIQDSGFRKETRSGDRVSPERCEATRPCEGQETRSGAIIKLHEGSALDILPTLTGPFDMVFIDADKLNYAKYLDWAEANIRQGGLIVGDNTLLFGHVWSAEPPIGHDAPSRTAWEAMREFNARLADPAKYHSVLIPTLEGMTIAIKR